VLYGWVKRLIYKALGSFRIEAIPIVC
jgi:hypothetical protein